jgi:hypothetical protein
LVDGRELQTGDAADLEKRVERDPNDVESRARLIAHYLHAGNEAEWARHTIWMIENRPEHEVRIYFHTRWPAPVGSPSETDLRIRAAWLEQVDQRPADPRILAYAARAMAFVDPVKAVELNGRVRVLDPHNQLALGGLITVHHHSLLSTLLPERSGHASFPSEVASRLKVELESSTDAEVLGRIGQMMVHTPAPEAARDDILQAGKRLLERAHTLDPANPRWTTQPPQNQQTIRMGGTPARINVPAADQARRLISKPDTEYPEPAKQARIQGTVRITVVID